MGKLLTLTDTVFSTSGLPLIAPNPSNLFGANLVGWWSVDSGLGLSGSRAVSLTDRSSSAVTLVQSTSTEELLEITNAKNGLPGLQNDTPGTQGKWLASSAIDTPLNFEYNQPFSVAIAFVCGATREAYELLIGQWTTTGSVGWYIDCGSNIGSNPALRCVNTLTTKEASAAASNTLVSGTAYSYVFTYDGSGLASGINIYLNGSQQTSTIKNNTLASSTLKTTGQLTYLNGSQTGNSGNHVLLETFVVNRVVTASEVTNADFYTNARYAIH